MAGLLMSASSYRRLMGELARRGQRRRESGAFLLAADRARRLGGRAVVVAVAYYDDLDPRSLTGCITMHDVGFAALNRICRDQSLVVVGDVHTHPGAWVHQSDIDAANPMIGLAGQIALIAPRYAQGHPRPSALGAHRYGGARRWESRFGGAVDEMLRVSPGIRIAFARVASRLWRK